MSDEVDELITACTESGEIDSEQPSGGVYIEPPPFSSVEEAKEFLHNHEIATNNKYVVQLARTFSTAAAATMDHPKTRWTYPLMDGEFFDGIPYSMIGIKKLECKYGKDHKVNQYAKDDTYRRLIGLQKKSKPQSRKVNCPATARMTMIVKFPDYAITENKPHLRSRMGRKLRDEFCEDTQRYVLIYVRIYYNHQQHGAQILQLYHHPDKITQAHVESTSTVVLKPGATLRGKSLAGVTMQFACFLDNPETLARPNTTQRLETMDLPEMLGLYWAITGTTPNDVFTDTQIEFTEDKLRILLHLCIIFANVESEKDGQIVAHRSVRIDGTENDFEPLLCCESDCKVFGVGVHMHCPLCSTTTGKIFTDPEKLKHHYRLKHIRPSIDCAGLKILRCRNECVVKGSMKDVKAYTAGHWHCWKCEAGNEHRPEIMKHLHSHVRDCPAGSVMVTKSVYPSTDPHTVRYSMNPAQMKAFLNAKDQGPKRKKRIREIPVDIPVKIKKEVVPDHNNTDGLIPISTIDDNDDDPVESDYIPVSSEVQVPAGFGEAVYYIQDGTEQVAYVTQSTDDVEEFVVHIPEKGDGQRVHDDRQQLLDDRQQLHNDRQHIHDNHKQLHDSRKQFHDGQQNLHEDNGQNLHEDNGQNLHEDNGQNLHEDNGQNLHDTVKQLRQSCSMLKQDNASLKSQIATLQEKIKELESKQTLCDRCSSAVTKGNQQNGDTKGGNSAWLQSHKDGANSGDTQNKTTGDVLKEALLELRSNNQNRKTMKIVECQFGPKSETKQASSNAEVILHALRDIKREVDSLKMVSRVNLENQASSLPAAVRSRLKAWENKIKASEQCIELDKGNNPWSVVIEKPGADTNVVFKYNKNNVASCNMNEVVSKTPITKNQHDQNKSISGTNQSPYSGGNGRRALSFPSSNQKPDSGASSSVFSKVSQGMDSISQKTVTVKSVKLKPQVKGNFDAMIVDDVRASAVSLASANFMADSLSTSTREEIVDASVPGFKLNPIPTCHTPVIVKARVLNKSTHGEESEISKHNPSSVNNSVSPSVTMETRANNSVSPTVSKETRGASRKLDSDNSAMLSIEAFKNTDTTTEKDSVSAPSLTKGASKSPHSTHINNRVSPNVQTRGASKKPYTKSENDSVNATSPTKVASKSPNTTHIDNSVSPNMQTRGASKKPNTTNEKDSLSSLSQSKGTSEIPNTNNIDNLNNLNIITIEDYSQNQTSDPKNSTSKSDLVSSSTSVQTKNVMSKNDHSGMHLKDASNNAALSMQTRGASKNSTSENDNSSTQTSDASTSSATTMRTRGASKRRGIMWTQTKAGAGGGSPQKKTKTQ